MNIHVLSVVISHNDFGISGVNIYLYLYQSIAKGSLFHLYLCQHVVFTREQIGLHKCEHYVITLSNHFRYQNPLANFFLSCKANNT